MKIRLLSDVHHEFCRDERLFKTQGEDVLVIAGDLNVGALSVYYSLMSFYEEQKNIIYVPGNHEYYRTSIADFDANISALTRDSSIRFLNPGSVVIDGVAFIGAALWTDFRKNSLAKLACSTRINDFRQVNSFSPEMCSSLHLEHLEYIKSAYEAHREQKKVIVTHFLPAVECIALEYRNEADLINYYFATDNGEYISGLSDTTWLFGHTHSNVDVTIGDTRCIANPYGYNRNPSYVERIIEV